MGPVIFTFSASTASDPSVIYYAVYALIVLFLLALVLIGTMLLLRSTRYRRRLKDHREPTEPPSDPWKEAGRRMQESEIDDL